MNEILKGTLAEILNSNDQVIKLIASGGKIIKRLTARPLIIKGEYKWQIEWTNNDKAIQRNVNISEMIDMLTSDEIQSYKQINIMTVSSDISILISSQGKVHKTVKSVNGRIAPQFSHNKEKKYLIEEGMAIQPMVDLKVFTADYKVITDKYDKFRQINRFIEIIDHEVKNISEENFRIMDFGCGKSYLTFLVYYYFKFIRKVNVEVIGYDLKEDVVADCNNIAVRYGYDNLKFIVGDLSALENDIRRNVDMVISLHACDTATDYALYYAINSDVKYIFSVPCCQHEINNAICGGGNMAPMLRDGLIKERFSALLTDTVRAELLRECGYEVDVVEFVDFSHSPKNLMLRCRLVRRRTPNFNNVKSMLSPFDSDQCLYRLLRDNKDNKI